MYHEAETDRAPQPDRHLRKIARSARTLHKRRIDFQVSAGKPFLGSLHLNCEAVSGTAITVDGRKLENYASCSYLGLEQRAELFQASVEAMRKFGTQFSSSKTFISVSLFEDLQSLYSQIFETEHVVLASTTTLAHQAAVPIIVDDCDLVVVDKKAHNSIHVATDLLLKRNVEKLEVTSNDMVELEEILEKNRSRKGKVWYFGDGIYSMSGAPADLESLENLRNKYENLHLYIDDAHGMTWAGKNGCGFVLSRLKDRKRTIVAVSHSKAFGSAGGSLIFTDPEEAFNVRHLGAPLIFSVATPPAVLGASLASAQLHLSGEIGKLQLRLSENIEFLNHRMTANGIRLDSVARTPIFFVRVGSNKDTTAAHTRLMEKGFYTNPSIFPAVARGEGGIRFTVTAQHSKEGIAKFSNAMKECLVP